MGRHHFVSIESPALVIFIPIGKGYVAHNAIDDPMTIE
jgi:hypothetical protein